MEVDASGWSGEGELTKRLLEEIGTMSRVRFVKIEDAPASRADAYLRAERIVPPYQTRGCKLIELVRLYEAGTEPRREG
jgi:hypothetical protein